jgi:hypothetical protein
VFINRSTRRLSLLGADTTQLSRVSCGFYLLGCLLNFVFWFLLTIRIQLSNSAGTLGKGDTAGTLMVPTADIDMYVQDLTSKGFTTDSTYNFNDIRAGDEQILLVWTTSGKNLNELISTLQEITPQLPYS